MFSAPLSPANAGQGLLGRSRWGGDALSAIPESGLRAEACRHHFGAHGLWLEELRKASVDRRERPEE